MSPFICLFQLLPWKPDFSLVWYCHDFKTYLKKDDNSFKGMCWRVDLCTVYACFWFDGKYHNLGLGVVPWDNRSYTGTKGTEKKTEKMFKKV